MTLVDLDRWEPGAINAVADAATKRARDTREVAHDINGIMTRLVWEGDSYEAASAKAQRIVAQLNTHADECDEASRDVRSSVSEAVSIKSVWSRIQRMADQWGIAIDVADGSLNYLIPADPEQAAEVEHHVEIIHNAIVDVLRRAESTDQKLAAAFQGFSDVTDELDTGSSDSPPRADTVQVVDNKTPTDKHDPDGAGDQSAKSWKDLVLPPEARDQPATDTPPALQDTLFPPGTSVDPASQPKNLDDALFPPGTPQPGPTPNVLDQLKGQLSGQDGGDPRSTGSPLSAPVVGADPSVVDQQAARVNTARARLDAAQSQLNAAAGQGYTSGPGGGPRREVTDALSQSVFDARRDLTEQTAILADLNQARVETGGRPVGIPALPPNADVQSFPQQPSAIAEGSRALNEGSFGLIPDVAKDVDVFTNWGQHSGADQAGAVIDAASSVPIPGAKFLGKGIEHGLDALTGATHHLDDIPIPHADPAHAPHGGVTETPNDTPMPVNHHADTGWNYSSDGSYSPQAPHLASELNNTYALGDPISDLARQVADHSTHHAPGANADRVVLGRWDGQDAGYIGEARHNGGIYFDTGDRTWDALAARLSKDDANRLTWQVNEEFLRTQLASGTRIDYQVPAGFASVDEVATTFENSFSAREIRFLKENATDYGYQHVGNSWVYTGGK